MTHENPEMKRSVGCVLARTQSNRDPRVGASTHPTSSHENPEPNSRIIQVILFLAVQAVLLAVGISVTWAKLDRAKRRHTMPALRETPITVEPLYDEPAVVDDEQLRRVLDKLRPKLRGKEPKINHVDHALRFWGVEATFADENCLSGREMLELLVDHGCFADAWGPEEKPLLIHRPHGVAVRTKEGASTASHVDHTLAGLAEIGLPIDFPLRLPNRQATVRQMLEHSLRNFSLNQVEYEWTALAYALYAQSSESWISSEGQEITLEGIADRIMRQKLRQGVCYGNHRLHTLTVLLRVDRKHSILSDEARAKIVGHLKRATEVLISSQRADGYWNEHWDEPLDEHAAESPAEDEASHGPLEPLARRLLATGHTLEWWALAPEDVHPPREVLARAGSWLSRTILEMDDEAIEKNYTFLTHAGRSLALWRGHFPAYFLNTNTESDSR